MTSMPQNTAEFQFYKYKSLMKFCVGERIEVKDRQHRWKCKGVVASIDSFEPQQSWLSMISKLTKYHTARQHREKFIVIALDECIHVQYDDLEAHYAAQLRLNPQQVVIVTNTLSRGNNIDIGHIMQSSSNGGSSTELLVCMMCQRVKCTNNMFMISTNEVLCKTHLCPWDDIAKLPITSAMYPLYHFTQEKIEEIGLSVMNMETKCLAFAKDWGTIKATELVSRIFSDEMLIITYTKAPEARVFKQELSWYQVEESLLKGCLEILKKKLVEEAKLQEEFAMEAVEPSAPEESQREEEGGGTLEQSVVALSTTNAATDANRRNSQDNYNNYQMESSWKVIDSNENFMMLNEVVILELQHPPMYLVLEAGMTYDDLMLMLQGNIPTFDSSHALLYIKQNQDMYGHYQQLVNQTREEVEGSPGYNLGIHQLKVTEQAFLQLPTDACGPILMFSSLPSEFKYNSSMVTKHGILNEWYHGYRKIRGDGNCYYRAVMIGLLEQVLSIPTNNTARYDKLTSLMEVVNLSNVPAKKLYEMLEDARGGHRWNTIEDFFKDLLETDLSIDYLLIQVAKHLVANYITCHGDQDFMGMSLQDAILSIYSNFSSLEEYLDTYILKMDVSAEGPFVDLGLLLKALRCKGVSIFLDRRAEVPISILETNYEEEDTIGSPSIPIADIHILLRPGHYDLLYHRYQSTDISGSHNQGLDIIEQMRERIRSESHPQPITDCTTNPQLKTTAPGTVSSKDKLAIDAVDDHHNMYNGYTDIYLDQKVDRLIVATFHSHEMKLVDFAGQSLWKLHVDEEHDVETYADLPFTTQAIIERSEQSLDEESLCQEAMRAVNHSMYVTGRWIFLRSNSSSSSSFSNSSICSHTIADQILFIPRYLLFFIVEVYIEDRETAAGVGHSLATAPSSNHLLSNTFVIALNMKEALHVKDMETAIWYNIGLSETDVQFDHDQALESLLMQHLSHAEQPIESDPMLSFYLPRLKVIPKQRRTSIVLQYIDVSLPVEVVLPMNQQALEILVRDVFDLSDLVYVEIYREGGLLTSNVNMDFDLAVVLEVKFCGHCVINHHIPSVDEEGKQRELITLTNCQHILCLHCLESLIDTSFPQGQYMYALPSMENLPWDADRSLLIPEFRGMQCPTCTKDIFSIDVEVCDRNGRDWQAVLATIPPKKVHKQCCMPAYCMDEDFYPVDDLIQLSCSHFFHEPCIVGSVRNQIESAKRNIQTIICPKCKDLDVFCTCPNCSWKPEGYHVITVDEIKSWLGPDDDGEALQQKEFDAWERIGVLLATDDATKTLSCRCGCIFCVDKQATSVQCPTDCGYCICVQCEAEAHPNRTCQEREIGINLEEMFPRTCFCGVIGILPTACNHITCHNCKLESCFLCEAAHLSVVSHGNHYHHDKCHFYKDCCDEKCLQMNKQHCKHDKYKPGPCQPCRDAKHHNACTHSNWKPCNKCLLQKIDCRHDWCPQCTALGSLCSPILPNHDTVKIFDYNQVEQKKKEM